MIHLHLWAAGYRLIPTIGPLFLAQSIAAFVFSLLLVVLRGLAVLLVAAGLMAGAFGGFLISMNSGLFGFHDSFRAPFARVAFFEEIAALAVLVIGAGCVLAWRCRIGESSSEEHAPNGRARALRS